MGSFLLQGYSGPPSKGNHINKSTLEWEAEQCFFSFFPPLPSLPDGLIYREPSVSRVPSNDKAGWRGECALHAGVVEAD